MTDQEAQNLLRRFAAPLFRLFRRGANTPTRKKGVYLLVELLWMALVTGPETEEFVFQKMGEVEGVDSEFMQLIKGCYYQEMKPAITEEEIQALNVRYKDRKYRGNEPCPCGSGKKFKHCHGKE